MNSDNKYVEGSESWIVQYDDRYADIPLDQINEAETFRFTLVMIDRRQYRK